MEEPKNENEQVQTKEIKNEENKEFDSLQTITKMTFGNQIIKIKELSNKRFGVLLTNSLLIYNLNTFKKLYEIELPKINKNNYYQEKGIFDFIELKNLDLVLWTSENILFYKLSENEYKLYQNINSFDETKKEEIKEIKEEDELDIYNFEDEDDTGKNKEFNINSLNELSNNKLVCCNSLGLIIYKKENDKYVFESKHEMDIDVRKIIEITENKIILLQRYHYYYWHCSRNNYFSHKYLISIYDIDTKNITKLATNEVNKNNFYGYTLISYLIKNGLLLIRYGNRIDIYDLNNNMTLVNHDQDTMVKTEDNYYGNYKILKNEMDIIFLCDYLDNYLITKTPGNEAKIYMLKDNSLHYIRDFPYQLKGLNEIIKLKNNSLIMYSKNELQLLNKN